MASEFQNLPAAPSILVFRGGALGDFILTLPVFQALRQAWPRAELTLVGYPHIAELAKVAGLVQQVLSIDAARFSVYFAPECPLPPAESDFLRSFDLVISFLHDPDGGLRSNWVRAGARRVVSVSPQVTAGHAADHFLGALVPLGMKCPEACTAGECSGRPRSRCAGAIGMALHFIDLSFVGTKLESLGLHGPVIALHPGSGGQKKNWSLPSFLALAGKIQQCGLGQVLWIVGEADEAIARSLEKEFPSRRAAGNPPLDAPILKNCSLPDVASVLSQCRGYVGNDSGITHLAATVGIPTVALFGPTDPAVWGPRGRKVSILRGRPPTSEGLARITVEEVWRKLAAIVE